MHETSELAVEVPLHLMGWDGFLFPWTFSIHDFEPITARIHQPPSNLQSEEMIYYVSGKFGSRKGVEVGSVTLHPSGIPHGPHPGLAEKSIGMTETHELAVMCDTFYPLKVTKFAKELDDGKYAYSWYEEAGAPTTADEDPAGVTSHF